MAVVRERPDLTCGDFRTAVRDSCSSSADPSDVVVYADERVDERRLNRGVCSTWRVEAILTRGRRFTLPLGFGTWSPCFGAPFRRCEDRWLSRSRDLLSTALGVESTSISGGCGLFSDDEEGGEVKVELERLRKTIGEKPRSSEGDERPGEGSTNCFRCKRAQNAVLLEENLPL